jgi:hypothetical protein
MLNRFVYTASFILFLLVFFSCQENTNEPNMKVDNVDKALKEGQRDYGTAVHGIVYKLYSPASNVIVKLYKGETLLDQDTTDDYGYYEICVCCQHQGTGTYTVLARKDYKGQIWVDTESFYWDIETGPFDFEIDLHLT